MTRLEVAHAIMDALERVATAPEYYRLNHAGPIQIGRLADLVVRWCQEVGVSIESDQPGHG